MRSSRSRLEILRSGASRLVLAAGLLAGSASLAAAEDPREGLSDDVKSAYACLIGGSTALGASLMLGGQNLTNLIAGGVVAPQNPTVLYIALVGVVFAAFCSISESLLPIYTYHIEGHPAPARATPAATVPRQAALPVTVAPERVNFRAGVLGTAANGAARRMGATAFANHERQPGGFPPVLVAQER